MLNCIKSLEYYNKNIVKFNEYIEFVTSNLDKNSSDAKRKAVLTEGFMKFSYTPDSFSEDNRKYIVKKYENNYGEAFSYLKPDMQRDVFELFSLSFAVYKWCDYKQIYSFDKDTLDFLYNQKHKTDIDYDFLEKLPLPYDTLFIENDFHFDDDETVRSILVTRSLSDYGVVLNMFLFYDRTLIDGEHRYVVLNLAKGELLEDRINETYGNSDEKNLIYGVLNLLMYLSQPKVEILRKNSGIKEKKNPKTNMPKSFYNANYDNNEVGYKMGVAIRNYRYVYENANKGETGRTVKPHMRSGHFHSYWTGEGRTKLIVKFLEPTFVKGGGNVDPVLHKVK